MAPKDFTLASAPAGTMVSSVSKRTSPKQLLLLKSDLVRGLHCLCCCAQAFSGCRHSCPVAYGIFQDQGSDPCSLHWQADSSSLGHQGSPKATISIVLVVTNTILSHEESLLLASVSWPKCAKLPLIHPVLG